MLRKLLLGLLLLAPLAAYPVLRDTNAHNRGYVVPPDDPVKGPPPLTEEQQFALACVSVLPGPAFPASVPWEAMRGIGQTRSKALEDLAKNKPIAFLEMCLEHYEKSVRGYRLTFLKQERVQEKMRPKETVKIHFREKPFSVHMDWVEGRGKALRTLYV